MEGKNKLKLKLTIWAQAFKNFASPFIAGESQVRRKQNKELLSQRDRTLNFRW